MLPVVAAVHEEPRAGRGHLGPARLVAASWSASPAATSRAARPKRSSRASYDTAVAARLWRVSAELVGLDRRVPERLAPTGTATGADDASRLCPVSERYDCTDPDGRAEGIPAAAAAVRRGEIVVLPTDTVYGIGCDAFDATAVASVLAAKGRGRDMPPPVLIPTARTAQGLATQVPDYAQRLMERFWPGPLTLVLKAQTSLHWDLGETNGTVALRVPGPRDHPRAARRHRPDGRHERQHDRRPGGPHRRRGGRHARRVGRGLPRRWSGRRGAALDDRRLHRRDPGDPAPRRHHPGRARRGPRARSPCSRRPSPTRAPEPDAEARRPSPTPRSRRPRREPEWRDVSTTEGPSDGSSTTQ